MDNDQPEDEGEPTLYESQLLRAAGTRKYSVGVRVIGEDRWEWYELKAKRKDMARREMSFGIAKLLNDAADRFEASANTLLEASSRLRKEAMLRVHG